MFEQSLIISGSLFFQEAFIIADDHLRLDLLYSFQNYTNDNDDGGTAKGDACSKNTIKEEWNNRNNDKADCTDKYNIVQNIRQVIRFLLQQIDILFSFHRKIFHVYSHLPAYIIGYPCEKFKNILYIDSWLKHPSVQPNLKVS